MTTRLKTVEYAFDSSRAVLAATTFLTFGAMTLTIPETSSRVFKNVYLDVTAWDACTAGTQTINASPTVGVQLAAVAFSNTLVPIDLTIAPAFGNNQFHAHYQIDVTSYFVTNFGSGTTQTVGVQVKFPNVPTSNISCKVVITYEYDETNTTRVKTVRIPLEGYSGGLPAALTQIGGAAEIPNLSTFLPEASVSVKNIWFEISAQQTDPGSAAWSLGMALDSASATQDSNHLRTLSSSGDKSEYFLIWTQNSMTTNATHAFKLSGGTANVFTNPVVIMCVTYTYNHSTTTTVLNSLVVPMKAYSAPSSNGSSEPHLFFRKFFVEEGSPTLVQSSVVVRLVVTLATDSTGGPWTDTPSMIIGSQSARTYYNPFQTSGGCRGSAVYSQRFDSGGTKGSGLTLAAGENSLTAKYYGSSDMPHNQSNAVAYLNYTSSLNAAGDGAHNHTIRWLYWATLVQAAVSTPNYLSKFTPTVLDIPEANYWITSLGTEIVCGDAQGSIYPPWSAVQILAGEKSGGGGWFPMHPMLSQGFDRPYVLFADWSDDHKRSSEDVDASRMQWKTSRLGRSAAIWSGGGAYTSCVVDYTYHSIVYHAAGSVTGYSGDGSAIQVDLHRADTGERMATTTTAAGGSYTLPWYDNTINVYAEAYQDGTHLGRSVNALAS